MKKMQFFIILCFTVLLSLFAACNKNCEKENCKEEYDPCTIERPKDVKPIDWENYNDVYTVYWNYRQKCSEAKVEDVDKDIMIYGWILGSFNNMYLVADKNTGTSGNPHVLLNATLQVHTILETSDLTKKCFIKGKLFLRDFATNDCCSVMPLIVILNANDIYFE
jgi:hypothetical protein